MLSLKTTRCRKNYEITAVALSIITFIIIIKNSLEVYKVEGSSMQPRIHHNELIISNKLYYGLKLNSLSPYILKWRNPKNGDMVVLIDPQLKKLVVKKIIGSPKDKIEYIASNIIKINGEKLKIENKIKAREIPKNKYFVIGENKDISLDSRDYGFVNVDNIVGKVINLN